MDDEDAYIAESVKQYVFYPVITDCELSQPNGFQVMSLDNDYETENSDISGNERAPGIVNVQINIQTEIENNFDVSLFTW